MSDSGIPGHPRGAQGASWGSQGASCASIVSGAAAEGVLVTLWCGGMLKVQGQGEAFTRWADIAWERRAELERYLAADER